MYILSESYCTWSNICIKVIIRFPMTYDLKTSLMDLLKHESSLRMNITLNLNILLLNIFGFKERLFQATPNQFNFCFRLESISHFSNVYVWICGYC